MQTKNLNLDIPHFKNLIPSTENLAVFIWNKLRDAIAGGKDLFNAQELLGEILDEPQTYQVTYGNKKVDFIKANKNDAKTAVIAVGTEINLLVKIDIFDISIILFYLFKRYNFYQTQLGKI